VSTRRRKNRKIGKGVTPANLSHLSMPPEVLRDLAKRELHIQQARHDVNAFNEYVLPVPKGVDRLRQGRIHREWHRFCDQHQFMMIIAPRLHWKTQQMLGRVLYTLGQDVNEIIKVVCASDKKAIKRLTFVRNLLKNSDELHRVFPHLDLARAIEENKHMITLERSFRATEPTVEALGITSSGTGDRATGILADDVVDRRNSITLPKTRESIKDSWDDWINLLPPGGWLWYLATLWHRSDLTHLLMESSDYAVARYDIVMPGYSSRVTLPDGTVRLSEKPLWGSKDKGPWTKDALEARRRKMTPRQFLRSFSNEPMADGEMKVKPEWIRYHTQPPPSDWPHIVSLDLASAQTATADYTGVTIAALNPDKPHIKVVDSFRLKITFPEKVKLVQWLRKRYRPAYVLIEKAAGGRELAEHLIVNHAIGVQGVPPRGGKGARLEASSSFIENGMVTFPRSLHPEADRAPDRGCLISEILGYGMVSTDDLMDSFTQLVLWTTTVYDQFVPGESAEDYDYDDDLDDDERDPSDDGESCVLLV
jgi:predicted phage terminase large subunit-like protein